MKELPRLRPSTLLIILTGLNFLNYLDRYIVAAVLPHIKAEMLLSDGQLGRISTTFMLGYFITSPLFGYLGDRGSRKWLIAFGIFIWSLGTLLSGLVGGLVALLACRLLVGFGEASYATISPGLISDTQPPEKRNNALTIFYVAIPVGSALGYIFGGKVSAIWGWREAFLWAGAPGLFLALLMLPFREPLRGESEGKSNDVIFQTKPTIKDVLSLLKIRQFVLLIWGYVAYTFALGAFAYWGPSFLARKYGVSNEAANTFFGATLVLTGLVGTMLGGFGASFLQKKNPAGFALVLGISAALAVPTSFLAFTSADPITSKIFIVISMLLLFLSTGPTNTLLIESVPVNLRSSAMAMSIFMIHLFGDMWSPEIVGRLSDHWQNLSRALLILPVALIACSGFWLALARLKLAKTVSRAH